MPFVVRRLYEMQIEEYWGSKTLFTIFKAQENVWKTKKEKQFQAGTVCFSALPGMTNI